MHVIIGGAHNGKRDYVNAMLASRKIEWLEGSILSDRQQLDTNQVIVVAGIEKWLAETKLSEADAIDYVLAIVAGREAIVILTDIGRGIVPIDAQHRKLRDACGRLYQRLMAEADEVTRIWYGLAQTLKKRGEGL
ncbi:bifunctional adenosylcobinamide kinase/adenosylcobinamide-phosphate guanylyltransferase [Sporosarcina beigongshangi]|uniref:bifunctional adenosylcobinamide kinase/adenosylcobinamide-phosphate guanylyltransferase n=1 Tax=Sporosarcina beigongshangi TaxID=2782538 RepID=UPI00193A00E4|nr:bifunctional adenosylcobinamide kinase/adenosylcobinamide-phosphate guanylyltransferase [Sporosarcina beigongshangi]